MDARFCGMSLLLVVANAINLISNVHSHSNKDKMTTSLVNSGTVLAIVVAQCSVLAMANIFLVLDPNTWMRYRTLLHSVTIVLLNATHAATIAMPGLLLENEGKIYIYGVVVITRFMIPAATPHVDNLHSFLFCFGTVYISHKVRAERMLVVFCVCFRGCSSPHSRCIYLAGDA